MTIFKQILEGLVEFFTSSKMKTFYWQTADAFLAIVIVDVNELDFKFIPIIASGLMILTRYVNKQYLISKKNK